MKNYIIEIRWAIFFTLMMMVWMIIERISGLHSTHIAKHAIYTNLVALPAILIYYLALSDKRNNYYGGRMSYNEGFRSGLALTIIIAAISPLSQMATSYLIAPDFFGNMKAYVVQSGQMTATQADEYFNLKSYIIQGLVGSFVMGVVTTAIVILVVCRKQAKPA